MNLNPKRRKRMLGQWSPELHLRPLACSILLCVTSSLLVVSTPSHWHTNNLNLHIKTKLVTAVADERYMSGFSASYCTVHLK